MLGNVGLPAAAKDGVEQVGGDGGYRHGQEQRAQQYGALRLVVRGGRAAPGL